MSDAHYSFWGGGGGIHFYGQNGKPKKFYIISAMDFGHRITYVTPKLYMITCLFMHTRLLKAHTKLLETQSR